MTERCARGSTITCAHCGKTVLETRRPDQRFCSHACANIVIARTRQCATIEQKIIARIQKTDTCWLWTGAHQTGGGYGLLHLTGNQRVYAHRAVYEMLVGPIPPELELDHLCRVPRCCNPAHLEPVTRRENCLRGMSPSATNARKDACIYGHPFDAANTYVRKDNGGRMCRACKRRRDRGVRRA